MKRIMTLSLLLLFFIGCQRTTVMTYNIHATRGMDKVYDAERIADVILKQNPDLVALQEVDQLTERSGYVDVLGVLKDKTGYYGVFAKTFNYQGGEFGNAILSRFPILETKIFHLPSRPEYEPRLMMMISCLNDQGDTLHFYNTHLDHHQDDSDRSIQMEKIVSVIKKDKQHVVLAGDFNCQPGSQPLDQLDKLLKRSPSSENTYPSDKPDRMIDHIYYNDIRGITFCKLTVIDERIASDHRPIVARFKIK